MSIQKSVSLVTSALVMIFVALAMFWTMGVSAHETGEEHEETEATQNAPDEEATVSTFNYTAQPGDSYSLMARKAVQTFGIESSTNLSGAQIIFVETNLTKLAESPRLVLGQEVSISREVVQEWSEKAKSLSELEQAAWQVYANNANFNTNHVGEAHE